MMMVYVIVAWNTGEIPAICFIPATPDTEQAEKLAFFLIDAAHKYVYRRVYAITSFTEQPVQLYPVEV
jgi:hypothetical protein